jgi:hypothetical protein
VSEMRRESLWEDLDASNRALIEVGEALRADPTPERLAAVIAACHEHCEKLAPVIGSETAFAFEAAFSATFSAAVSVAQNALDPESLFAAQATFEQAYAAVQSAVAAARAMDGGTVH